MLEISAWRNALDSLEVDLTQGHLRGISYTIFDVFSNLLNRFSEPYKVVTVKLLKSKFSEDREFKDLQVQAIQKSLDEIAEINSYISTLKIEIQLLANDYIELISNQRRDYEHKYQYILDHCFTYISIFHAMVSGIHAESEEASCISRKNFTEEGDLLKDCRIKYAERVERVTKKIEEIRKLVDEIRSERINFNEYCKKQSNK